MVNHFYRFEFEESFKINAISLYSDSLKNAINQVSLILGESCMNHVQSINILD